MASRLVNKQAIYSYAGQALIEFALILPLLMLLIIGLFDLGMAVYTQNMIANSAREGARTGILLTKDDTAIQNRVRATAPGLNITDIRISPAYPRTFNQPITVTVVYTYTSITPMIGQIISNGGRLRLSSTSVMIVEGVQQY